MTIAINPFTDETLTKIFTTLFSIYVRVRHRTVSVGSTHTDSITFRAKNSPRTF